jgi:L-alanine-DL-glutamate epimerase-like enolase superfamily enzyme
MSENTACRLRVLEVDLRVHPMRTRFPFRYGIASMTAVPHLFVKVELDVEGKAATGIASDGLPPKWFTKNPQSSMEQDLAEMIAVIQHAAKVAQRYNASPLTYMDLWQQLKQDQAHWGAQQGHPPLLWNFGISLVERATLDALCKATGMPLHRLVKSEELGVDLGEVHPTLEGIRPAEYIPESPLPSIRVRHTVGLADPIRVEDIRASERLLDGLPQALEECIPAYGLRCFKIKFGADLDLDRTRLRAISETLASLCTEDWQVTLDGNEFFHDMAAFRSYFEELQRDAALQPLLERMLWVEQPMHRDHALDDAVGITLRDWKNAPTLIIDESDGSLGDAHRALTLGYAGTSHKNCKGVLKGLANAGFIHRHRLAHPGEKFVISGEDLVNVGPIALLQDLAVQALLGVPHVERNGHHYFRGLSMYPPEISQQTAGAHPDLYTTRPDGLTALQITNGELSLRTVNEAPFGSKVVPDLSAFPTLKEWIYQGGLQALTQD